MLKIKHQKGNKQEKAFSCLYDRYAQDLFDYFYYRFLGDEEKAKDFLQDLFLKLINPSISFNAQKKFRYWIYHIASNMCKNEYRKISTNRKHMSQILYETNTETLEESPVILWKSLRKLRTGQRELIILRYKYKLSIKDIASIINTPEGTVKSRLFTCIQDLSKIIKNNDK